MALVTHWVNDTAVEKIASNGERLRKIIGAVDPRLPVTAVEFEGTTSTPALVALCILGKPTGTVRPFPRKFCRYLESSFASGLGSRCRASVVFERREDRHKVQCGCRHP
jgi:hypothetical protein